MPSFALLPRCPFSPRRLPSVFFTTCLVLASSPPTPPASDSCSPSPRLHRHIHCHRHRHRHNSHSATSAYVIQQETDYISRLSRLHKHNASKILSSPHQIRGRAWHQPPQVFFPHICILLSFFFAIATASVRQSAKNRKKEAGEREAGTIGAAGPAPAAGTGWCLSLVVLTGHRYVVDTTPSGTGSRVVNLASDNTTVENK